MGITDYDLYMPIYELWKETHSDFGDGVTVKHMCCVTYRMKIARKWQIYFWRIGIFTMILSFCSLAVFALDKEDVSDRFETLFTLLLAAVAFQYIINSELPKLPYLTLMDIYVLFSFAFVFMVIACVFSAGYWEVDQIVDDCFFVAAGLTFVVFHIWFVFKAYKARQYEMKKIGFSRWDYGKNGYDQRESKNWATCNEDVKVDQFVKERILERPWWTDEDDWAINNSVNE